VGCNAGDCGACTVMLEVRQGCACLTAVVQAARKPVVTVKRLSAHGALSRLQRAVLKHGDAPCGVSMRGVLLAASHLLAEQTPPDEQEVSDAIGGVLCRCTGYRKIVAAVLDAAETHALPETPQTGMAVGSRTTRVDGMAKVVGQEKYGADYIPADALWVRIIRSPQARATIKLGDFSGIVQKYG